jgi:hypothetical protein
MNCTHSLTKSNQIHSNFNFFERSEGYNNVLFTSTVLFNLTQLNSANNKYCTRRPQNKAKARKNLRHSILIGLREKANSTGSSSCMHSFIILCTPFIRHHINHGRHSTVLVLSLVSFSFCFFNNTIHK